MCGLTYSQNERVGPMAWKYIYVSVVPVSRRQNSIVQKSNVRVVVVLWMIKHQMALNLISCLLFTSCVIVLSP